MGSRTPLYDAHVEAGAKIVDFGGWDMPLHYGSQLDEHHIVRREAGAFDVSHMTVVDVTGSGASDFLRRLLANDVARLKDAGKALYSFFDCSYDPATWLTTSLPTTSDPTAIASWSMPRPAKRISPGSISRRNLSTWTSPKSPSSR